MVMPCVQMPGEVAVYSIQPLSTRIYAGSDAMNKPEGKNVDALYVSAMNNAT